MSIFYLHKKYSSMTRLLHVKNQPSKYYSPVPGLQTGFFVAQESLAENTPPDKSLRKIKGGG